MKNSGFTLAEMLVVMVIIGILATLLSPSFLDFFRTQKLRESELLMESTLLEGFNLARSSGRYALVHYDANTSDHKINLYLCADPHCNQSFDHDNDTTTPDVTRDLKSEQKFIDEVTINNGSDFEIVFAAPHGDIMDAGDLPSGTDDLSIKVTHTGNNKEKFVKIYKYSGLIE